MAVLVGIGFLAGVITAVSPCVLPVLPIVLAGSATGGRRRPLAIVAGLALSFGVFTLFAAWILDRLGLPKDLLRNVAIGLLFLLAASLIVPQLGTLLERPFYRFSRLRAKSDLGSGFLLGASLGLVFVPCAGPVLGVIATSAATFEFGVRTIVLTAAYALGVAVPMLLIATGGQRAAEHTKAFRVHAREFRAALGVVIAASAFAVVFHVDEKAQTAFSNYTNWFQGKVERSAAASHALGRVNPRDPNAVSRAAGSNSLDDVGRAPDFVGISRWFNTPDDRPLSMAGLRGKVVLVDFWTYTCINCLRTLPHVEGWYDRYRNDGLVVVGVHTPEFAFEAVPSNVQGAINRLGVHYPVALDPAYGTWNAYGNQYWPADYLVDRRGHVRHVHFGEGDYGQTEDAIRTLLAERVRRLPPRVRAPDLTPRHAMTPESYLGADRLDANVGMRARAGRSFRYRLPRRILLNGLAFGGTWRIEGRRAVAGRGARLRLHFLARDVYLVLSGHGRVRVRVNGGLVRSVPVTANRLYTLVRLPQLSEGVLDLTFTPGVSAYAFTFG
jgi:cytochrome c biogenesis protein CcdA/thiol-disulfide isomerase/thioredoxin